MLYSIDIYATSYKKTAYIRRIYDTVEQSNILLTVSTETWNYDVQSNETSMLSQGQHVTIQKVLVEALNTDQKWSEVTVKVLMDTGRQRTYITLPLLLKLVLEADGKKTLIVYTFGNKKQKAITTGVVIINLNRKGGESIKLGSQFPKNLFLFTAMEAL